MVKRVGHQGQEGGQSLTSDGGGRWVGGVGLHLVGVIDAGWQGKTRIDHQRSRLTLIGRGGVSCWSGNANVGRSNYNTHTPWSGFDHQQTSYGDGMGSFHGSVKRLGVRGGIEQQFRATGAGIRRAGIDWRPAVGRSAGSETRAERSKRDV